ncbi:hypothetical protein MA16_Dca026501 [Dendrobium catenatum]|uniref:Retrotransposon gag domain-containing protein n=1 Tax=Dendrobium catenatum TaxID=906689 RepID=A0A2I0VFW9_9ASPA|nr:hypothetical protein MA16_Dca026501 [Dendrobium catenatum]
MESFTQMMQAMTQMIRTSQNQTNGSGNGGRPMNKSLKLFQDMKPPLFASGGPIEAEDWLMRIEKILEGHVLPRGQESYIGCLCI